MVGGRVLGGEGIGPGFVVAHPASPLGPLSHERPRHPQPLSKTNPKSADDREALMAKNCKRISMMILVRLNSGRAVFTF